MRGFGDSDRPLAETVEVLEELATKYIIALVRHVSRSALIFTSSGSAFLSHVSNRECVRADGKSCGNCQYEPGKVRLEMLRVLRAERRRKMGARSIFAADDLSQDKRS